jgi:hypothetical protein
LEIDDKSVSTNLRSAFDVGLDTQGLSLLQLPSSKEILGFDHRYWNLLSGNEETSIRITKSTCDKGGIMEDDEQVSRRSRISSTTRMQIHTGGSTTSSNNYTRMTPTLSSTSSNGSSGHLPLHSGSNNAQSGGASLLQERLRERRGRDMRMSADFGRDVDLRREIHSSPSRGSKIGRDERRPSSSGVSQPIKKPMGVKQMEEVSGYFLGVYKITMYVMELIPFPLI